MQPTAGDVYERLDIQERNKPGFCKRNLKWVIACAVFTVVLIITLALVLVFVVGRNIAQQQLDDAALINVRMQILSVQESSATVRLQALLDNRGHDGASIDASTVTLSIYPSGQAFGQLNMPAINAGGGTFTALNITQTLQVTDKNAFTNFGRSLLDGETVTVTMSAKVSASARGITFKDLDLTKVITLKGHNGFRDPPIRVLDMKVQGGAGDVITLGITAEITNVADVMFADAGVLNLSMSYQGVDVGYAVSVGRASFPYGPSIIHQIGYITRTPQNRPFIESIFGQYTSGQTVTLTLHGNEQTTDIALLNPVLKTLSASAQLPGLTHQEDKLFANVYMKLTPDFPADPASCNFTEQKRYTDVYIFAKNPLDVDISLNSADFLVTWDGDADKASYSGPGFPDMCSEVGYPFLLGRGVNDAINMKIPAKTTVVVPQRVCVTDNDDDLQAFTFYLLFCKKLSPGVDSPQPAPLFAHVKGHAVATIGTYLNGYMDYEQRGIPAVLHVVSPSDNQALPAYRFE